MFETDRLKIRRMVLSDAPFMLAMLNDPGFLANIGDRDVRTIVQAEAYIRNRIFTCYVLHGFGMYHVALKDTGEPVGMVGFAQRDGLDGPDLGYAFLAAHVGRGYGREAAQALMAWGRKMLGIGPLLAFTAPHNRASAALLAKLGFRETGRVTLPTHKEESRLFVQG